MDDEAQPIISDLAPPRWWRFRRPGRVLYRYGDGEEANTLLGYFRSLFPEGGVWATEVSDPELAKRLGDAAGLLSGTDIASELDALEEGLQIRSNGNVSEWERRQLGLRVVGVFRAKRIAPFAAWLSWSALASLHEDVVHKRSDQLEEYLDYRPDARAWSQARDIVSSGLTEPSYARGSELRFDESRSYGNDFFIKAESGPRRRT